MRNSLWFGSIVCVLAVIPGWLVGALLGILFYFFNADNVANSDFLFLRSLFGLQMPGEVWSWIFARGIPVFIQGAVAGTVAIAVTKKAYLGDRLDIAAIIASVIYLLPLLALAGFVFLRIGLEWDNLHDALQWLGLALGLLLSAQSFPTRIKRQWV